jgi:hypothetical protein
VTVRARGDFYGAVRPGPSNADPSLARLVGLDRFTTFRTHTRDVALETVTAVGAAALHFSHGFELRRTPDLDSPDQGQDGEHEDDERGCEAVRR